MSSAEEVSSGQCCPPTTGEEALSSEQEVKVTTTPPIINAEGEEPERVAADQINDSLKVELTPQEPEDIPKDNTDIAEAESQDKSTLGEKMEPEQAVVEESSAERPKDVDGPKDIAAGEGKEVGSDASSTPAADDVEDKQGEEMKPVVAESLGDPVAVNGPEGGGMEVAENQNEQSAVEGGDESVGEATEKAAEAVVDKPAGEEVEKPAVDEAEKPAEDAEKPATEETEKPVSEEVEKPAADETEKPAAEEVEKPAMEEAEKPAADETEKPAEEVEKPATEEAEKPATDETEKPAEEVEKPATEEAEKPAADETEKPAEEVEKPATEEVEKPATEEAEKPATDETEKPAEEVEKPATEEAEKPAPDETEKPAEEVEKPAADEAEKPAEEVEKPATEEVGKPATDETEKPATEEAEKPAEQEAKPADAEKPKEEVKVKAPPPKVLPKPKIEPPEIKVTLFVKAHARFPNKLGDCPFSHRVMMILKAKKIGGSVCPVNLSIKSAEFDDFCARNGLPTKVPIIQHGETVIGDSNLIADYLDKLRPEPNLVCKDKKIIAAGDKVFLKFSAFVKNKVKTNDDKLRQALVDELEKLDMFLGSIPGRYLAGDELTHPDCSLLPKLHHVRVASKHYKKFEIPEGLVNLHGYLLAADSNPVFNATAPTEEAIIEGWRKHV
eukprot:gene240-857_t